MECIQKQPSLPKDYNREFCVGNQVWTAGLPRHTDSLYDETDFRSHTEGNWETFAYSQTRENFAITPFIYYMLLYHLPNVFTSTHRNTWLGMWKVISIFPLQISEDSILTLITMTQNDTPLLGCLLRDSPVQAFEAEMKTPKCMS